MRKLSQKVWQYSKFLWQFEMINQPSPKRHYRKIFTTVYHTTFIKSFFVNVNSLPLVATFEHDKILCQSNFITKSTFECWRWRWLDWLALVHKKYNIQSSSFAWSNLTFTRLSIQTFEIWRLNFAFAHKSTFVWTSNSRSLNS